MEPFAKYQNSPICPVCNYRAVILVIYNGRKMCHDCKKNIQRGKPTRHFNGQR